MRIVLSLHELFRLRVVVDGRDVRCDVVFVAVLLSRFVCVYTYRFVA